jgi:hypothetical protein
VFVLNLSDGLEVQYDLDSDGKIDGAPVMWAWTHAGTAYPPVVGYDDTLYFRSTNMESGAIPGATVVGWKIGTPILNLPVSANVGNSPDWPSDEPVGISAGGKYLYWNMCDDRSIGSADLSKPNTSFPENDSNRQWRYITESTWPAGFTAPFIPYIWHSDPASDTKFHTQHGDNVGPIIYGGKLYVIRSNNLVAFAPNGAGPSAPILSLAKIKTAAVTADPVAVEVLKARLAAEVQKMLAAGHLRSGYGVVGIFDSMASNDYDEDLMHYWHNPADTIYVLLRALPHLPFSMQADVKSYIQSEFDKYPPYAYKHIGFTDGSQREAFEYDLAPAGGSKAGMTPESMYVLWKYAQTFGSAKTIFDASKAKFPTAPEGDRPHEQNAYIAGLVGYLELEKLAGYPESADRASELNTLLTERAQNFTWDVRHEDPGSQQYRYWFVNIHAWNFMYLVPELADYLNLNAKPAVETAVDRYSHNAPYWFVGHNEEVQLENGITPYYPTHALFQAKALILKQPYQELVKYLDTPVFPVGDLFYIDNLVSAIKAGEVYRRVYTPHAFSGGAPGYAVGTPAP